MANVLKATRAALGHLFKHYERGLDSKGEPVKFGNQNIDSSRSHLNYNLAPKRDISQGEFVKQRCSEVHCLKRKDINVMCSWVVTMPKDLPEHLEQDFFKATYKFLADRYGGEQNVVSAYVHKDEVTPHLHFAFVPVTFDKKKDRYKVSAKEVINKTELQRFHKELQEYLESVLGCPVNVLNEATLEGNKSIEELKRGTAQAELAQLKAELEPYIELKVNKQQFDEEPQKQIKLPFKKPRVSVTAETWQQVTEQALAYIAAKKKIEVDIPKKEKQLDEREKKLVNLKNELMDRENDLMKYGNIVQKYQDLLKDIDDFARQAEESRTFRIWAETAIKKLAMIAKAIANLKYGSEPVALTEEQDRTIEGMMKFAYDFVEFGIKSGKLKGLDKYKDILITKKHDIEGDLEKFIEAEHRLNPTEKDKERQARLKKLRRNYQGL